jgi:hypothetical protein
MHQQVGLTLKEESNEILQFQRSFKWCWDLEAWKNRLKIAEGF